MLLQNSSLFPFNSFSKHIALGAFNDYNPFVEFPLSASGAGREEARR